MCLNFHEMVTLFSEVAVPSYISTSSCVSVFFTCSPTFIICLFVFFNYYGLSAEVVVISRYGFDLHFLNAR